MSMPRLFKEAVIRGQHYRVGRLSSADGSWVAVLLTDKMREARRQEQATGQPAAGTPRAAQSIVEGRAPEEAPPQDAMSIEMGMLMTASFLIAQLSRQQIAEVQEMCLHVCCRYDDMAGAKQPIPIMSVDGRWLIPELEYDAPVILELVKQTMAFNISPFFLEAESSDATTSSASSQ